MPLGARLAALPHGVLAELCARVVHAAGTSPHHINAMVEGELAAHVPPSAALREVVASVDLATLLSAALPQCQLGEARRTVPAVCKAWRKGWCSAAVLRAPILRPEPLARQLELGEVCGLATMAEPPVICIAMADGERDAIHVLDHAMNHICTLRPDCLSCSSGDVPLAAGQHGLYCVAMDPNGGAPMVALLQLDSATLSQYRAGSPPITLAECCDHETSVIFNIDLDSASDRLFAATGTEVVAMDARTLQVLCRFGDGMLQLARDVAVLQHRVCVVDSSAGAYHVFHPDGAYAGTVHGEWQEPWSLCASRRAPEEEERLYLVEDAYAEVLRSGTPQLAASSHLTEGCNPRAPPGAGRRIYVITPEGATLQVYAPADAHAAGGAAGGVAGSDASSIPIYVHTCVCARMLPSSESALLCISTSESPADGPRTALSVLAGA